MLRETLMRMRFIRLACLAGALILAYGCWREREEAPTVVGPDLGKTRLNLVSVESFKSPLRLTLTRDGQILVSDTRLRMVLAIDPVTLTPRGGFKVSGKPLGVAATRKSIFVGNATKNTVEIFDAKKGTLRGSFGPGVVDNPVDLDVDESAKQVFVLDGTAGEIKVFDTRGRFEGTIVGPGIGANQLTTPMGLTVDPFRREVLVSDWGPDGGDASVKIFAYDGTFIDEISGAGRCGLLGCSDGFSRPGGLAVDAQSRVYIADALLAQVVIFDRATKKQVGALGARPILRVPTDVLVDENADVYVVSNRTRTVEMFVGGAAL